MSTTFLVLTVIGDDRPGLVEQLAAAISSHRGNWLESSMAHLAGKFAGIVEVSVATDDAAALRSALGALPTLKVTVEEAGSGAPSHKGRRLTLSLVGHDRIGIVREVSQVLARHAVNVEALNTFTASAPMSAEVLFHAQAELQAAESLDARALKSDLERISDDLMVDITLDEVVKI
ncbi:glycine cleavage system protein R [Niveibacterium sp. 24ML]|uniref:glycine cleavage system protein R n=1 Tax=Niveibacterium sp. 24ML TaxID=2985512 RepID=UPI0022719E34|nr:ACT domain-containing protein [Niveibacterium sp. 24ML]MCX9156929.1 glycine cleavage system protein R [Niveibacterium sp. 24ML]